MKLFTRSMDPEAQLGVAERTAYMTGNIGTALVNTIIASFLLFFYTDVLYLNGGIIGTILLFSRIFDGVTDILMGMIVDRTKSKHGRSRVWIIRMCIPFAISGVLLMFVPTNAVEVVQYVYVAITYNLCNAICLTALYTPYNSMAVTISSNQKERTLLSIFVMAGAVIGTLIVQSTVNAATGALTPAVGTVNAWRITIAIYAALGLLMHIACYFGTRERCVPIKQEGVKLSPKKEFGALIKNPYWIIGFFVAFFALFATGIMGGSGMYLAKYILGDEGNYALFSNAMSIAQVVGLVLSFVLATKLGKRNLVLIGMAAGACTCIVQGIFAESLILTIVMCALRGFAIGLPAGVLYAIAADTVDYSEWKYGVKAEGVGMAVMSMATKLANGLSVAAVGWLTEAGGLDATLAVQPESALVAINFSYNYVPAICCGICALLMVFYKLDKMLPTMKKELAERRIQDELSEEKLGDLTNIPHGDMPGDKIEINEGHIQKAKVIYPVLKEKVMALCDRRAVIAVCGGSGVGKSEIASLLAHFFTQNGMPSYILSGDNYPHRIPSENDKKRMEVYEQGGKDALIAYLGSDDEIDFAAVQKVIDQFKGGAATIRLKRMGRTQNELWYDDVDMSDKKILFIEWTHSNSDNLTGVDIPVLLNSTPQETLEHRRSRNRDGGVDSPFTTMVLEIEQEMLKRQAHKAQIIVSKQGEIISYAEYCNLMEIKNEQ